MLLPTAKKAKCQTMLVNKAADEPSDLHVCRSKSFRVSVSHVCMTMTSETIYITRRNKRYSLKCTSKTGPGYLGVSTLNV